MDCKLYECCRKHESCSVLGECVFGHDLMKSRIPQAVLAVHYGNKVGAIVNALRKLKNGKEWKGTQEAAQRHIQEIGLIEKRTSAKVSHLAE